MTETEQIEDILRKLDLHNAEMEEWQQRVDEDGLIESEEFQQAVRRSAKRMKIFSEFIRDAVHEGQVDLAFASLMDMVLRWTKAPLVPVIEKHGHA